MERGAAYATLVVSPDESDIEDDDVASIRSLAAEVEEALGGSDADDATTQDILNSPQSEE